MQPQPEIPDPPDTGSSGDQSEGSSQPISPIQVVPATGIIMAETMQGLAASRAKSFGGEVGAKLIASSMMQMSQDLERTHERLIAEQNKYEASQAKLTSALTTNAVLQERLSSWSRIRHFSNVGITIGVIALGASIEFHRNDRFYESLVCLGVGLLLIAFAWFAPSTKNP